ncbi:hypothetical protein COOONC_00707 [Cooperia oncophora]
MSRRRSKEAEFYNSPNNNILIFKTRRFTWNAMRAAQRQGRAIVFATDSAEECEVLCDRVGIVYSGRLLTVATVQQLKRSVTNMNSDIGNFVVIELCPATAYDKSEVIDTIRRAFPHASSLPNTSSCPQMLRWKIPFPKEASTTQYLDLLKEVIRLLPLRESSIIRAPLDIVAQNVSDALSEKSNSEKKN